MFPHARSLDGAAFQERARQATARTPPLRDVAARGTAGQLAVLARHVFAGAFLAHRGLKRARRPERGPRAPGDSVGGGVAHMAVARADKRRVRRLQLAEDILLPGSGSFLPVFGRVRRPASQKQSCTRRDSHKSTSTAHPSVQGPTVVPRRHLDNPLVHLPVPSTTLDQALVEMYGCLTDHAAAAASPLRP